MLSSHIMVVLIVTVVMVASVLRARYKAIAADRDAADHPDMLRSREELKALRDRIAVLERIATEKENSLEQEIERLRDR